jgi:hypothetical protein
MLSVTGFDVTMVRDGGSPCSDRRQSGGALSLAVSYLFASEAEKGT